MKEKREINWVAIGYIIGSILLWLAIGGAVGGIIYGIYRYVLFAMAEINFGLQICHFIVISTLVGSTGCFILARVIDFFNWIL